VSRTSAAIIGLAALCLVVAALPVLGAGPSDGLASPVGWAGARSLDDPFYPTLGNGGYDVGHYDLDLTWHVPDTVHGAGWLAGLATIDLRTTQDLSELSFDLTGANTHVERVTVDGVAADHGADRLGRKLIVTPSRMLSADTDVRIEVRWTATPMGVNKLGEGLPLTTPAGAAVDDSRALARGFLSDGDGGWFMASQPNGAHTLFPSNDYPTDKATVTVRLTAPPGMLGVATGSRVQQTANDDGTTTTTWASSHPVATHVLAMGVGRWSVIEDDPAGGPHLRSSVPADLAGLAPPRLDVLDDAVGWLRTAIGRPYPFGSLGIQMVSPGATDAVLEGQTLILTDAGALDPWVSDCAWRRLIVHETAHQWFGDSVSLTRWDQKWLSEGHATFYELLWAASAGCDPSSLEDRMRTIYADGQEARDAGGPPDRPLAPRFAYESTIYDQGALALYALRQEVGPAMFRAVETTWLDRYADGNASTDDFIALASEVAGRDLSGFLADWLRSDTLPPMPGHPDWVAAPRSSPGPTGSATPAR
jgi:aminopeptidase N